MVVEWGASNNKLNKKNFRATQPRVAWEKLVVAHSYFFDHLRKKSKECSTLLCLHKTKEQLSNWYMSINKVLDLLFFPPVIYLKIS